MKLFSLRRNDLETVNLKSMYPKRSTAYQNICPSLPVDNLTCIHLHEGYSTFDITYLHITYLDICISNQAFTDGCYHCRQIKRTIWHIPKDRRPASQSYNKRSGEKSGYRWEQHHGTHRLGTGIEEISGRRNVRRYFTIFWACFNPTNYYTSFSFFTRYRPSVKLRTFWSSVKLTPTRFESGNVLLTGAAGFLGSFILHNFIRNTEVPM